MIQGDSDYARSNALTSKPGLTLEESQEGFDKWATTYDQECVDAGYSSHLLTTKYLCDVIPQDARATSRVLDIGAGSGLVATKARHAETGSRIYSTNNCVPSVVIHELNRVVKQDTYDAVTGSGIYAANNYVPCDAIHEMIRVVKPGGYIVLVARNMLFGPGQPYEHLEPLMGRLERDRKWKQVHRDILPSAYFTKLNIDAIVWVYKKL
ncbi:uncharacterized protein LOC128245912 [Mya arenaria]|uniref:uncharacterized protein LOC128245912 n=1 Tax=Mya arenaria TaxID=6604 RepID=UPI0022E4379F|nr:uncharacterized protein LOC128245912 [Mya arenaria]